MKGSSWTRLLCAPNVRDQGIEKNPITKFEKKKFIKKKDKQGNEWVV